jgi:hypothetical protein
MGVPGSANLMLFGGAQAYEIDQSLRFNSADSAYLNRTNSSSVTNNKIHTHSFWVKRSTLSDGSNYQSIIGGNGPAGQNDAFGWGSNTSNAGDNLQLRPVSSGAFALTTTQVFRDASAWYHIVLAIDTTQATDTNRVKLYVNGSQITAFSSASYPAQNYVFDWNTASRSTSIGSRSEVGSSMYLNGYLTEINFIDGQQLTPSSFGETDPTTGAWIPKRYSGSYGTNGFYLKFADNSGTTSTTLGKDSSGNSNNWTPNNFSVTAGAGNDVLSDSPTKNWCTLNPLKLGANVTLSDGNLVATITSPNVRWNGTIAMSPGSGKYYAEMTVTQSNGYNSIGLSSIDDPSTGELLNAYRGFDGTYNGTAYGNTYTTGDVIGIAYDAINGALYFSKNGTWQNSGDPTSGSTATGAAATGLTGTYVVGGGYYGGSTGIYTLNFGQRAFAYTPPTGYKALNTANLPEPTIKDGGKYFNTKLWTGDGANSRALTGVGFQPEMVWIKSRSAGYSHQLFDAVRGAGGNSLQTNLTAAEGAEGTGNGYLSSFDSDGFTVATTANDTYVNESSVTYAAWCWDAGGAGSSNNAGTITSTVSANASAGFSIATYTGNGTAGATVGHGLGVAPKMIIVKQRSGATDWQIGHQDIAWTKTLYFTTAAATTETGAWNDTAPTSTVFSVGTSRANTSSATYVAYCFSEVAGYSKFGSYTGNGSSDGPFVFTGFKVAWLMWKRTDSTANWFLMDAARNTYNVVDKEIYPDRPDAENTFTDVDFLSNGFKLRASAADRNASGGTFVYAAFAELPFKYSPAR